MISPYEGGIVFGPSDNDLKGCELPWEIKITQVKDRINI